MQKNEVEMQVKSIIGEKEFERYKKFAFKDDMIKLTIGIILGNSFNKVVYGLSDYLVMPIFTFLVSQTGNQWREWEFSPIRGLNFELGHLIGTFVDFIMISVVLYLFYIKFFQNVIKTNQPEFQICKFCHSKINQQATKCPLCTGDLSVKERRIRRKNKRTKSNRGK